MKNKYIFLALTFLVLATLPYLVFHNLPALSDITNEIWLEISIVFIHLFIGAYRNQTKNRNDFLIFGLIVLFVFYLGPLGYIKSTVFSIVYPIYSLYCGLLSAVISQKFFGNNKKKMLP